MAVDSCLVGAGGICGNEYFRFSFPVNMVENGLNITHLELWAIVIAVRVWGHKHTGKILRIKTDNEAVSQIVNTGRSRDSMLQKILRELVWWLAKFEFKIKTVHIFGRTNILPDLLSRWAEGRQVHEEFEKLGGHKLKQKFVRPEFVHFKHEW